MGVCSMMTAERCVTGVVCRGTKSGVGVVICGVVSVVLLKRRRGFVLME